VKITASQRSGPFHIRLYTEKGNKATEHNETVKSLKSAYRWAEKKLGMPVHECEYTRFKKVVAKEDIDTAGVPDAVPDFDMAEVEDQRRETVPNIGLDDRLYTEDGGTEVPFDVANSGRQYTM